MAFENQAYLGLLQKAHRCKKDMEIEEVSQLLQFTKSMPLSQDFQYAPFFVLDYSKKQYKIFTNTDHLCIGYHPVEFFDGGLEFIMDIVDKDDFIQVNEKIYKNILSILTKTKSNEHLQYLFTFNFRVVNNTGGYSTMLQRSKYITDSKTGLPVYSFGSIINISPFKTDTSMVFLADRYEHGGNNRRYTNIIDNIFYPYPEDGLLTKREKEILGWLADGLSSKQISDKTNTTRNTVENHRKNMLKKTNSKNVAELIKYGIVMRII